MTSNLRRRLLVMLLAVPCLGAGPSQPGTDVVVGGGIGRYTIFGTCGAPNVAVRDVQAYGRISHQFQGGGRVVAEAGHSEGRIVDVTSGGSSIDTTGTQLERNAPVKRSSFAVRAGGAWRYGGFEVGTWWHAEQTGWQKGGWKSQPAGPSLEAWTGHPDYGYLWGRCYSGPLASGGSFIERSPLIAAGLGYRKEDFRVEAGVGSSGFMVDGDMRVWKSLRVGASSHMSDAKDWTTIATVGAHFGGNE